MNDWCPGEVKKIITCQRCIERRRKISRQRHLTVFTWVIFRFHHSVILVWSTRLFWMLLASCTRMYCKCVAISAVYRILSIGSRPWQMHLSGEHLNKNLFCLKWYYRLFFNEWKIRPLVEKYFNRGIVGFFFFITRFNFLELFQVRVTRTGSEYT